MKKILSIIALSLLGTSSFGQAVEEGNVIIDAYYGFPNLYTSVFKATYANSGTEIGLKIGGLGPLGGRVEYMLADKIGLGVDVGLNSSFVRYQEESGSETYDYDFLTSKFGVMATFNWHFVESSDNLDAYAMFGAGYGNRSFTFTSTDPDYIESSIESLIPVAMRIGAGMRYFFTDNIGVNLALGFGQGGLVNAGISAKF